MSDETDVLVKALRRSREGDKWNITRGIEEVPESTGHYALYDGIDVRSAGVTWNMRQSITQCSWFGRCEQPIYMWLPDADGTAALWLEGKVRCKDCKEVIEIGAMDKHKRKIHGEVLDEEEE